MWLLHAHRATVQEAFDSRRWNPILDIRYMNEENSGSSSTTSVSFTFILIDLVELLLVTHKTEVVGGKEVAEDLETLAEEDAQHFKENEAKTVAQHVYQELHIKKGKVDVETISGNWD